MYNLYLQGHHIPTKVAVTGRPSHDSHHHPTQLPVDSSNINLVALVVYSSLIGILFSLYVHGYSCRKI